MPAVTTAILAATAVAGLGMSAYGMSQQMAGSAKSAEGARLQQQGAQIQSFAAQQMSQAALLQAQGAGAQNQANKAIAGLEGDENNQRMKAMELEARRQQLEIIRNQQRARAMGLGAAANQGGLFGSGLQGGYGQMQGQTTSNLLGVQQNLAIGRSIFGIDNQISQQRLAYASAGDTIIEGQKQIAQAQGISAIGTGLIAQGGGVIQQGQGMSQLGQGFTSFGNSLMSNASGIATAGQGLANFGQQFFQPQMPGFASTYGGSMRFMGSNGIY